MFANIDARMDINQPRAIRGSALTDDIVGINERLDGVAHDQPERRAALAAELDKVFEVTTGTDPQSELLASIGHVACDAWLADRMAETPTGKAAAGQRLDDAHRLLADYQALKARAAALVERAKL